MGRLAIEDMIKALKCVASQDNAGDCYADYENFRHMNDNNYKRLVCRDGENLKDHISGRDAAGCPYYQREYSCCFDDGESFWLEDVAKLLEELKSYKDLEEQGLLVRVPCKVGDPVFFIVGKDISKQGIRKIEISGNGIIFKTNRQKRIFSVSEFGKTVFLTREEAEKKLKEMKK